jgi:hypothetical protein
MLQEEAALQPCGSTRAAATTPTTTATIDDNDDFAWETLKAVYCLT